VTEEHRMMAVSAILTIGALVACMILNCCTPPAPAPPIDATSPCAAYQALDQSRMKAESDGAAFDRPCPDGGSP
jgi:hypothetical protein